MVASIGHYIDNKPVAGTSGRTGDVTNPATGEVTAKVAFASAQEVDQAVQIAKKAQVAWGATPPLRRQRIMFNLKNLIEKRADDLARHLSLEPGKPFDVSTNASNRSIRSLAFLMNSRPMGVSRSRCAGRSAGRGTGWRGGGGQACDEAGARAK